MFQPLPGFLAGLSQIVTAMLFVSQLMAKGPLVVRTVQLVPNGSEFTQILGSSPNEKEKLLMSLVENMMITDSMILI